MLYYSGEVVCLLTAERLEELKKLSAGVTDTPLGLLVRLSSDWDVPFGDLARSFMNLQAVEKTKALESVPASYRKVESPFHKLFAPEDSIGIMPRNYVLMNARIEKGLRPSEIGFHAGMASGDYKKVEEGRLLPTADQAVRIAALLGLPVEELFPLGSMPGLDRRMIAGFSMLGLWRVKRRLSIKDLAEDISFLTGKAVTAQVISVIEKGQVDRLRSPSSVAQLSAIAEYFETTEAEVVRRVPPEVFQQMAQTNAQLHAAFKKTVTTIKLADLVDTPRLTDGGKA